VGTGGNGGLASVGTNDIVGLTAGTTTSFGSLVTANGGQVVTGVNRGGQNGGSGGGAGGNAGSPGGRGGTAGGNGLLSSGSSMPIGLGQGSYSASIATFSANNLSAGAGGAGGTMSHAGGGGAGGILINGVGLLAANGSQATSGRGGIGYGAGGGAGGYDQSGTTRYAGGSGASGLVYLEYERPEQLAAIVVATLPNAGTLYLDRNLNGIDDGGTETIAALDTIPVAELTAGNLKFTPSANGNGATYATFSFRVSDGDHLSALSATMTISVNAVNDPPTVDLSSHPYVVAEGGLITLDATASSDLDSDLLTHSWDLDNDNVFGETGLAATRGDETLAHPTFSAAGLDGLASFPISLFVSDSQGAQSSVVSTTITITNADPSIASLAAPPVSFGETAVVSVTAIDPAGINDPLSYGFDFDNDGTYEVGPQASNSASFTFASAGEHIVGVRVTDGDGGVATSSTTVTVDKADATINISG
jgi:hypothetical protein